MPLQVLIPLTVWLLVFLGLAEAKDPPASTTVVSTNATHNNSNNDTIANGHPQSTDILENRAMLQRAFYVLIAVTAVVVLYFVIKSVLLRRKNNKTRKYGIVGTAASELEMQPLDQGDEEDDMTLFEVRATKLK